MCRAYGVDSPIKDIPEAKDSLDSQAVLSAMKEIDVKKMPVVVEDLNDDLTRFERWCGVWKLTFLIRALPRYIVVGNTHRALGRVDRNNNEWEMFVAESFTTKSLSFSFASGTDSKAATGPSSSSSLQTHDRVAPAAAADNLPSDATSTLRQKYGPTCFLPSASLTRCIKEVKFDLHPTFFPSVVKLSKRPFRLRRVGWGVFSVGITLTFLPQFNHPPVTLDHFLNFSDPLTCVKYRLDFSRSGEGGKPQVRYSPSPLSAAERGKVRTDFLKS